MSLKNVCPLILMMNTYFRTTGDTVLVSFKKASTGQANKVYHITLDIDSYPIYHFVTIDGDTYSISCRKITYHEPHHRIV
jgi:hypothetical protein